MKHVLITGGAGFIGSNLVDYFNLKSPETKITVVDDFSTGLHSNLSKSRCEVREHTILDYDLMLKASVGVDSIVHLAALGSVPRSVAFPRQTHETNSTGTLIVLEAARHAGVPHVVVASSSSVYGSNPAIPKRESDWVRPMSPYGVSKLATESYALAYRASYGMKTLAFRFFNVYGPRQRADHDYAAVIPRFISAAMGGQPLVVYGDGTQFRDFTYVESVCAALLDACEKKTSPEQPINLAFGTSTTILRLIEALSFRLGFALNVVHEAPRGGDVVGSQADSQVMRETFPTISGFDLEYGLERVVHWFREASG